MNRNWYRTRSGVYAPRKPSDPLVGSQPWSRAPQAFAHGHGVGLPFLSTRRSGSAFSPLSLAPVFWLRGDLGITLNGGNVSGWGDQSGNGNHVTQATPANQPAYDTTVNGITCPRFDGSNDIMSKTAWSGSGAAQPFTQYVVCTRTDNGTQGQVLSTSVSGNLLIRGSGASNNISTIGFGGPSLTHAGYGTTGHANPMITRADYNGASSVFYAEKTGAAPVSTTGNLATAGHGADLFIGARSVPDNFWKGCVCEVLVYPLLSAPNDLLVRTYLRARWGVAPI